MYNILKKPALLALAAAALAFACNEGTEGPGPDPDKAGATGYLAVRLSNGSRNITKAPAIEEGSPEESKAGSLIVLLFEYDLCIDAVQVTGGTIGNTSTPATASDALVVDGRATHALVVVNPESSAWSDLHIDFTAPDLTAEKKKVVGKSWSAINQLLNLTASDVATDDRFTMANAGSYSGGALVPVTVVTAGNGLSEEKAKELARQKAAAIHIDRLSAKVTFEVSPGLTVKPAGTSFAFSGWELNVTNKSSYLYSELVDLSADPAATGDYRQDGNYDLAKFPGIGKAAADRTEAEQAALRQALRKEFGFLLNAGDGQASTSPVNRANGSSAYCLENTMDAAAQKRGVTTTVVLRAQYTPQAIEAVGETNYFKWNQQYYTLAGIKLAYKTEAAVDRTAGIAKDLPVFLRAAQVAGVDAVTTDAQMDAFVENLTAGSFTAESGIVGRFQAVEYFHNSVCYYEILIRHDQGITGLMALGRYGVVRNNWYTVSLQSVTGPGTPWIPDPSDPDPANPSDPGTDDDPEIPYLSVAITVRPWDTWSYEVDI